MQFTIAVATLFAAFAAAAPGGGGYCKPGTYQCTPDHQGWQVCNTGSKWEYAGACPPDTSCKFYPPSLSPYCVGQYYKE